MGGVGEHKRGRVGGREMRRGKRGWVRKLVDRWMSAMGLTVVWLQSVGMCARVAVVTGAALEAVLVLLLAVADAVHAVCLDGRELHALDVHLCTQEGKKYTIFFFFRVDRNRSREKKLFISTQPIRGHIY